MIDRKHDLHRATGGIAGHQQGLGVLLASTCQRCRPGVHAKNRRVAPGTSVHGCAHAARPIGTQGLRAGGRHIATLMRRMGIEALAPQPDPRSPSSITAHIRFVHHFFEDQDGVVTKFLTGFGAKLMTPLATNSSNRAAVTPVTLVNTSNVC